MNGIISWKAFWSQEIVIFGGTNEIIEKFKIKHQLKASGSFQSSIVLFFFQVKFYGLYCCHVKSTILANSR